MKYHALFVIFEKVAKFEHVVCCKLQVVLYGLGNVVLYLIFVFMTRGLGMYYPYTVTNSVDMDSCETA